MQATIETETVPMEIPGPGSAPGGGEAIPRADDDPAPAGTAIAGCGPVAVRIGPVEVVVDRVAGGRHRLTARELASGATLAVATLDLGRAAHRTRFAGQVLDQLAAGEEPNPIGEELEQALLQLATAPAATEAAGFRVLEGSADPRLDGTYAGTPPVMNANRRLTGEQAERVKRHVVEDLLRLHDPAVMHSLDGAAALAVLRGFAGPKSRPVIWLLGLTGGGQTFVASLLMNFFGDDPLEASGRIATWSSTANFLQATGDYDRDCLSVIDDFKPEMARRAEVVRRLQNAGDGTGRGRLRHDARARATRPVRGLILATAEDLPVQNASGRARSIVVPVPGREKDFELGRRCVAMSPLYRGLMADFLGWLICQGRGAAFAARVEHWQGLDYRRIAGRQNDARIAGTHAMLAAAFEEMAAYLSDAWPGAASAAEAFATEDVAGMVAASVGAAEEDQGGAVFLEALRALMHWGRARLERPGGAAGGKGGGSVVGRIIAGASSGGGQVVELSVAMALQAVRRSPSQQGKPPLQVSERALIGQLEAEGLLLDREGRPIGPGRGGSHSWQVRIERRRVRVIRMRLADLQCPEDEPPDEGTGSEDP